MMMFTKLMISDGEIPTTLTIRSSSSIVKGQSFFVQLKDINGNKIANETILFTVGTSNYPVNTDSNGVAGLQINMDPKPSQLISADYLGNDSLLGSTVSQTIEVKPWTVTETYATKVYHDTAQSGIPYKNFPLLVDGTYDCSGGKEIICGSSSSPIAAGSGSYNTPRGVIFHDFQTNIPTNSIIRTVSVKWSDKVTNPSGGCTGMPAFYVATDQVRMTNTGANNPTNNDGKEVDTCSSYIEHDVSMNITGMTVSGLNSPSSTVCLRWGKQYTSNPALLYVKSLKRKVEYTPPQTRPT